MDFTDTLTIIEIHVFKVKSHIVNMALNYIIVKNNFFKKGNKRN